MDEGTGISTENRSGKGNAGTVVNSPTWVGGARGNALSFNGTSQYTRVGGQSNLGTSNQAYTISGWIYLLSNTTDQNIIHVANNSDGTGWCITFVAYSGGKLVATSYDGGGQQATGATTLATGRWYHFADVWSGAGGLILYLNWQSDGTNAVATYSASGASNYVFTAFGGPGCIGDTRNYFNGLVDDVRIYNRALTAQDVYMLYLSDNRIRNATMKNVQFK